MMAGYSAKQIAQKTKSPNGALGFAKENVVDFGISFCELSLAWPLVHIREEDFCMIHLFT